MAPQFSQPPMRPKTVAATRVQRVGDDERREGRQIRMVGAQIGDAARAERQRSMARPRRWPACRARWRRSSRRRRRGRAASGSSNRPGWLWSMRSERGCDHPWGSPGWRVVTDGHTGRTARVRRKQRSGGPRGRRRRSAEVRVAGRRQWPVRRRSGPAMRVLPPAAAPETIGRTGPRAISGERWLIGLAIRSPRFVSWCNATTVPHGRSIGEPR